jgi:ABC-2 type transport system permease protein
MYSFMVQAWATYKGLFYWLNWMSYIPNVFIGPAVVVSSYALLGQFAFDADAARYYGMGIIMAQLTFIIIGGITQVYNREREHGTISFLYITPASRLVNFLSRALLHLPNGIMVYAVGLTALWLLTGVDFSATNWVALVTAVVVATVSVGAFAELLGIFSIVFRDWVQVMVLGTGLLTIFNGIIIPLDAFPAGLQGFAHILPVTNILEASRLAIAGGPSADIYYAIMREGIIAVVFYIIGYLGFVFFEKVVIRNGTLERDSL